MKCSIPNRAITLLFSLLMTQLIFFLPFSHCNADELDIDIINPEELLMRFPALAAAEPPEHKSSELDNVKLLVAQYRFTVPVGISFFSREHILNAEGFERFSKNTKVIDEIRLSPNLIHFTLKKRVAIFTFTSEVDYHYISNDEENDLPTQKTEKYAALTNGTIPSLVTIQEAKNFGKFFEQAFNICSYIEKEGTTEISCSAVTAMKKKDYNRLRLLTNLANDYRDEIRFAIKNIKEETNNGQ